MATQLVQRKWGKGMHTSNRKGRKEQAQYAGRPPAVPVAGGGGPGRAE